GRANQGSDQGRRRLTLVFSPFSLQNFRDSGGRGRAAAAVAAYHTINHRHAHPGKIAKRHTLQKSRASRVLCVIQKNKVSGAASFNYSTVQPAKFRGIAGGKAKDNFRGDFSERGKHGDKTEDAERLYSGTCRSVGAKYDPVQFV